VLTQEYENGALGRSNPVASAKCFPSVNQTKNKLTNELTNEQNALILLQYAAILKV